MKKLMIASAAVAAGIVFGDIESSNIVGYTTLSALNTSTYYMMGSQFETVTSEALKLSQINLGEMKDAPYFDDELNFAKTAPEVRIAFANQGGFSTYYYLADGAEDMVNPGWVDVGGNPVDPTIAAGLGFWYNNTVDAAPAVTVAGQVVSDAVVEKDYPADFRVLVNPYPTAKKLSDIDFGNIKAEAPYFDDDLAFTKTATEIRIPYTTQAGFATYYYIADGAEDMENPGWVDVGGNPADPEIPVGRGCWFKPAAATGALKVTFTK